MSCSSFVSSAITSTTNTGRMELAKWTSIFQGKANDLQQGDSWRLEFDDSLLPDSPNQGWEQYIRNTSARFNCSMCRRAWPSNRSMTVFHMRLINQQGIVKVRRFRQNCKMCTAAPMENPKISDENIGILLENLVQKIRIKCYHEHVERGDRPFVDVDVKSPHEPSHCEACQAGVCTRN